jgi:hypothetical protein
MRPRDHSMTLAICGVRMLAVSCHAHDYHHSADVNVDGIRDEVVVLFVARGFRCSRCGLFPPGPPGIRRSGRAWGIR